jgi:hypothetical protein
MHLKQQWLVWSAQQAIKGDHKHVVSGSDVGIAS